MLITAKFASTCPVCGQAIAIGEKVEWGKGQKASHITCKRAPTAPTPHRYRNWRPCGYPGCNPNYCDECDGEGYRPGH